MLDVETIKANGLCSGCGLCAGIGSGDNQAIIMEDTSDGFRRPKVVGKVDPQQAGLIDAVCPGANIKHDPRSLEAPYHRNWGPLLAARLGWSSDPALRKNASSGGGLSAILNHLLKTREVDYVVQTAVAERSPIRNAMTVSTDAEGIFRAAGSRYAPSSPLEDIGQRLDGPGRFVFVGKPCDVAGLRQLARRDPRVDAKAPYMIAFMCGGVPSYKGTSALLREMGVEAEEDVTAFRFRGDGWPGFATAELGDGHRYQMDYNTSWGSILNRHIQFRCKICADGVGEFADIVCADGWHLDDEGRPSFAEQEGQSLILSRTPKGENLVSQSVEDGALESKEVPIEMIAQMQPYQAKRKGLTATRLAAMALLGKALPRYAHLELPANARALGIKEALRSFLGMSRRLVKGQGGTG